MTEELWGTLPLVVETINVGDRYSRQLLIANAFKTHDVDAVHLTDRSFGSNPKRSDPAVLTEVVLILRGVEEVLRQFRFASQ